MESDNPFNNTRSKKDAVHNNSNNKYGKGKKKKHPQPDDVDQRGNIMGLIDYEYQSDQELDRSIKPKRMVKSEDKVIDLGHQDKHKGSVDMKQLLTKYLVTRVVERLENENNGDILAELDEIPESDEYTKEEEEYIGSLSKKEKRMIKKMEKRLSKYSEHNVPYRFQILKSNLDMKTKSMIISKLEQLYMMEPSEGEYHKLNRWVSEVMGIPFDQFTKPVVTIQDSLPKIASFIRSTKECLDDAVYGHLEAKTLILQAVAQQITNPCAKGSIIALQGPMGNGKTTLIKKGVAKAMKRPFAFIALGGATDSCFLEGHDFTYEGSQAGRIVSILKECKAMDPIIYFDELDKISDTPKGEEIANLLCHLTDHSQNSQFHDRYFSGIDFDLSKASFIFSFNNRANVNPILLDRMNVIETKGFDAKDKIKIASEYLLPEICENIGFMLSDVVFTDEILNHIISVHTDEQGVRNLKRCLETIISKLNLLKIVQHSKIEIVPDTTKKTDSEVVTKKTDSEVVTSEVVTSEVVTDQPTSEVVTKKTDNEVVTDQQVPDSGSFVAKSECVLAVETLIEQPVTISIKNPTVKVTSNNTKSKEQSEINKETPIVSYEIKNLKFPITITRDIVEKFIKLPEKNPSHAFLYT